MGGGGWGGKKVGLINSLSIGHKLDLRELFVAHFLENVYQF